MSDYTAIRDVSQTLEELVEAHVTSPGVVVRQASPKEMQQDSQTGISLWLYRVTRNEHLHNQRPARPAADQLERHCLPINLHYLVTPILTDPADEQEMLGRILQTFNDHPVMRGADLRGGLQGSAEELRVTLDTLSVEESSRIWAALQEPFQAALAYQVQYVCIDSDHQPLNVAPVAVRETTYSQIVAPGESP
jgi:hypothetical protein